MTSLTLELQAAALTAATDPYALPALWISILSLAVAVLAAITGIVALAWQIGTRRRGAHRVKINVHYDYEENAFYITANNSGASDVQITAWGIHFAFRNTGKYTFGVGKRPRMLAAGHSDDLWVSASESDEVFRVAGDSPLYAQGEVTLGTGKRVRQRARTYLGYISPELPDLGSTGSAAGRSTP